MKRKRVRPPRSSTPKLPPKRKPVKAPIRKKVPPKRRAAVAKKSPTRKPIAKPAKPQKRKRPSKRPTAPRKKTVDRRRKPWEKPSKPIPVAQLRDERPLAQAFLAALTSHAFPGEYRTALNADHTIDGQVKIEKPSDVAVGTFVDALESQYWMVLGMYPPIGEWWFRAGALFYRVENEWRKYELEIFQGKEGVFTNQVRLAKDAAEIWKSLRMIIRNVINAYQEPNPRTGALRPMYELTHVVLRIHRGHEPPLY